VLVYKILNHHLSEKLKLIRRDEFNYLIYVMTLPLMCGFNFSLIGEAQNVESLIEMGGK
jgi:hypothetical protein